MEEREGGFERFRRVVARLQAESGAIGADAPSERELEAGWLAFVDPRCSSYDGAAERMGVSPRTVHEYLRRLSSKLGLRNQADLTRYAMERGLVSDTPDLPLRR